MLKLCPIVSDLWFNHDHSEYAPKRNVREDYDLQAMLAEAEIFAYNINAISGCDYTAQDFVDDFFERL